MIPLVLWNISGLKIDIRNTESRIVIHFQEDQYE